MNEVNKMEKEINVCQMTGIFNKRHIAMIKSVKNKTDVREELGIDWIN